MTDGERPREPRFMRPSDVAFELSTSLAQVRALIRSGELRAIQIGGRRQWRVEHAELDAYVGPEYERAADARHNITDADFDEGE
jgi:excisionase family DNA binding protein